MQHEDVVVILTAENARQREQIAALVAQNAELAARVQELEARLAKDSHNSGKPPSSDGLGRKTRSLRRRSGKKPGGQLGHRGETLHLVATPDAVVEHRPSACTTCQAPLDEAEVLRRERRQVLDLPRVRLTVTEHQALHVRCAACQAVSVGAFPADAPSRAQYGRRLRAFAVYLVQQQFVPYGRVRELLADLAGASVSLGTLLTWVQQCAAALAPVETRLKAALRQASILHHDETGVRRSGRLAWAHVASTARLTHYAVHAKRGSEATDAVGILPAFTGVSVHDGWKPYWRYTRCRHALCNIHHLRELTFLEEQCRQTWAKELKALLREMKATVEQARATGLRSLPTAVREALVTRYRALLAMGHAANPPPERRPHQRGRVRSSHPPATCSNVCGWVRTRCSPSSTTSPFPSTTTKPSAMCACSRSSRRFPGRSAQIGARTRSLACVATFPPSGSKAWHCWLPSKPSSPVSHSTQTSPEQTPSVKYSRILVVRPESWTGRLIKYDASKRRVTPCVSVVGSAPSAKRGWCSKSSAARSAPPKSAASIN
jgi:transposase